MARYRLCCMSQGRSFRCEDFDAADDAEAIELAGDLRGVTPAQLWAGFRLVSDFPQSEPRSEARVFAVQTRAAA